jgi:hypothetical protein
MGWLDKLRQAREERNEFVENEGRHYADTLPHDAMEMSKAGVAHGYETLRFGMYWNDQELDPGTPVIQIDADGVQLLILSDDQKKWINTEEIDEKRHELRRKIVRAWNYTRWEHVTPANHEYLLTLHWVPAEPYTAMEIIAIMAKS